MAKLAVLGLGNMGSALAKCLLNAGHTVNVWNRTPAKAEALSKAGAQAFERPDDAIAECDFILVCIKGHKETLDLVRGLNVSLAGKTICETSTGDTVDAEKLVDLLNDQNADYMLGMINCYPSHIGLDETTILTVGRDETWERYGDIIRTLGGKSAHVGETPASLAALFAGLFTVRQGFMYGMIYGALVCKKAGIPMEVYADQIPASLKLVNDYYSVFARTVPSGDYDNAEAALKVYTMAQEDALNTYKSVNAPDEFIQLMYDRSKAAWDDGYGDLQLTSLVRHMAGD